MRGLVVDLFFDLLEINIVAAVIIIVLCLFAGKLRKRYGAGWMKMIWILLAVRLLIPYNFSIVPLAGISFMSVVSSGISDPEQVSVSALGSGVNTDTANMPAGINGSGVQGLSGSPGQNSILQNHTGQTMDEASSKEPVQKPTQKLTMTDREAAGKESNYYSYVEILTGVWVFGVLICLTHTVIGYMMFLEKYQKDLCPVRDKRLQEVIFGTGNRISVYQSRQISSPMLIGLIHPKLVIPAARKQWKMGEMELIIKHELCHYQKKDLFLKLLMVAAQCVNWMDPAIYFMKKQFFFDMELACDEVILNGRGMEERELYARTMLSFAGNKTSAFSSSFFENKKQIKGRIDNIFDPGTKKKGFLSAMMFCIAIPIMGLAVSCGYKPSESDGNINEAVIDRTTAGIDEADPDQEKSDTAIQTAFDYNHAYNKIIRVYKDDIYLTKEDGIYYIKDGQGEGELIYPDNYRRLCGGMDIHQNFLYFCGSAPRGGEYASTIYRMDLDTHEVYDALAVFDQKFNSLYNASVYDGKLYVADENDLRIGFELNPDGSIGRRLDEKAEDFLYKEYNDYRELSMKLSMDTELGSEEYRRLENQLEGQYVAAIDVAACKKLLNGSQIVSKYKDETSNSYYLETDDNTYEYLMDSAVYPRIITEDGIYYNDEIGRIWYVDHETKQQRLFYEDLSRKSYDINMINYDADYIYATQERLIGYDTGQKQVIEMYLIRIPRAGGDAERVYKIEDPPMHGSGWHGSCAVYFGQMYLEHLGFITLDPDVNGMQRANSKEPCEDAVEMKETAEDFAAAYFGNDEKTLRSLLTDDFAGTVELYAYPENVSQIEEKYLAGLPDDNIATGVTCWLSYEFSGHEESDGALVYLSMQVAKTQEGFRIRSYGLEQ